MAYGLANKKILIVDDFSQMRSTLKHMLQSIGATDIDAAVNGREALEVLRRKYYDIVLCDYNLGEGKDGQQVLEEAKYHDYLRYSSIFVMITAENTMEMVMGAMEYKPDDYLTKPFNKDLLRRRLDRLLARKADFEAIERAVHNKDLRRAVALCDEKIAQAPRNVSEFRRLKAELCMQLGDFDAAESVFDETLAQRQVPWALLGKGQVQYHRGLLEQARDTFQQLIAEHRVYMEAYDWLARTLEQLGAHGEAQEVLADAIGISPKSVMRQNELGRVAAGNDDYQTAERAWRKTVALGRESVYRDPSHYANLSRAQQQNGAYKDALSTAETLRKEFRDDPVGRLQAAVAEGVALQGLGREQDARKAYEEAKGLYQQAGEELPANVNLEMARAAYAFGDAERGRELMQAVVRNNHEDERLLRDVQRAFNDLGREDEGQEIIRTTRDEVAALNNEGVGLVKSGRLEEAIRLFEEAVGSMPDNKTVNLNAAHASLAYLQRNSGDAALLARVRGYLDRVRQQDPSNATLKRLSRVYRKLAEQRA